MWCSTCQQDVPAVTHPLAGQIVCARCQQKLQSRRPAHAEGISDQGIALDEVAATPAATAEPAIGALDDWRMRQRMRHVSRALRRRGSADRAELSPGIGPSPRFDPPHLRFEDMERQTAPTVQPTLHFAPHKRTATRRADGGQFVAWLLVLLGALALVGGVATIGWSLWAGQMQFWNLGLAVTLAGQGVLIFGLVLVVSRLWRNSRYASGRLQEAHVRLVQLQNTADSLTTMRGGAPAFYAELARGASPQMLLANLKGQLDQLTTRLGGNPQA